MRAMGLILAGGKNRGLKNLMDKRAAAAMPVAGNYRAIDFALSNMSNSQIQKVAILTQYNARSLNEHLNSSKWWNFGRKHGGMYVFTPTITRDNTDWYRGTADAIYQNLSFLKKTHEPYVILCSGDAVYKMDYNKVLDYHISKDADITIVVKDMPEEQDLSRYGTVKMDSDCRITSFEEKPLVTTSHTVSCGIYIFRRRQLIELIERCQEEERSDLVNDIIMPLIGAVTGGLDFSNWFVALDGSHYKSLKAAQDAGAATLNYGNFISLVINFIIIAFCIFLVIKGINKLSDLKKTEEEEAPTTKICPFCKSEIPIDATRCPNCTSEIPAEIPVSD